MVYRHNPPAWIPAWFFLSAIIIFWDAGYCLLRPRSMEGGDLYFFWKPYKLYAEVDLVYGWKWFNDGSGFTSAQALMNLIETSCALYYVYLERNGRSAAILWGYSAALMTLSKTILYWLQEYFSGFAGTGHNDIFTFVTLYVILNGVWIVVPATIVWKFGKELKLALQGENKEKTN